ncbi:S27A2 synthetase, partial [Atrichornis clamosus]|nr:S27A2 synthetase [Atrichornis clamosus]
RRLSGRPAVTLLDVFRLHARRRPRRPLLLFQDEVYTYEDVERRSNRAAWALSRRLGLRSGRTVAVLLPNGPGYVWTWLALAKLGCAMACLNCNVRGRALRHALEAAQATVVLASPGERGGRWGVRGVWGHGGDVATKVSNVLASP